MQPIRLANGEEPKCYNQRTSCQFIKQFSDVIGAKNTYCYVIYLTKVPVLCFFMKNLKYISCLYSENAIRLMPPFLLHTKSSAGS